MKSLEMNQMIVIEAGGSCVGCGRAIILGMMGGSIFGGWGSLIVGGLTALGPNCLDVQDTGYCTETETA